MGLGPGPACCVGLSTALTPEEQARYQSEDAIREILDTCRTVAMVGLSADPRKASHFVASYLQYEGFHIIPVNPRQAEILGCACYPDLVSVPERIDLVNVFRPSPEVAGVVDQAIAAGAKAIWSQLKIADAAAAEKALAAGLRVVMDKCVKIEHGRFSGGLHWAGMNTGILSAKRRVRR